MKLVILILSLLCHTAFGSTWYVRPCVYTAWVNDTTSHPIPSVGVYGTQDGTSYANAWNGLVSVVWGTGGVVAGDTLYVCGLHLYYTSKASYVYYQAYTEIGAGASGCTIRMDYAPDPGIVFGGSLDYRYAIEWNGPDENGVYSSFNFYGSSYYPNYEISGTNVIRLNTTNAATWTDGLGMWARVGDSNFVKTATGQVPTTNNIALNANGWRLVLPVGLSNVLFQSCEFVADALVIKSTTYPVGEIPAENMLANHITFRNCTFRESGFDGESSKVLVNPNPGNDHWTFDGCELYNGPSGIYTSGGYQGGTNQLRGVTGLTVTNCYIHDMDTANYPAQDGHGIGLYFGSGNTFTHNRIERTGTAIALYVAGTRGLSNNLVAYNFVKDIHWHNPGTFGQGIWISSQQPNTTTGTSVIGNIVVNAGLPGTGDYSSDGGAGISYSGPDHIDILQNTVWSANFGIYMAVNSYPPQARILNNIVGNTTNALIRVGNPSGGTVNCDYNLFYTNQPIATPFYFAGGLEHDTHSVFDLDPEFVGAGSVPLDFRIQATSPAKGKGVPLIALDYFGRGYLNQPAIGAAEIPYDQPVQTRRHALTTTGL